MKITRKFIKVCNIPKECLGTLCEFIREEMTCFNETCNKHCKTQPKLPKKLVQRLIVGIIPLTYIRSN